VEGRRIQRTSNRPQVLGGNMSDNTGPVRRSCQDCNKKKKTAKGYTVIDSQWITPEY
jgi:hypothetical protein